MPRRPRRPLTRALPSVVVALVLAAVGLVFPLSSSASAVGYPITYTVTNNTPVSLVLDRARVGQGRCIITSTGGVCLDRGTDRDFAGNVSPRIVQPRGAITINYELDPLVFKVPNEFFVQYTILGFAAPGENPRPDGELQIHETRNGVKCTVHGNRQYTCVETGLRTFELRAR